MDEDVLKQFEREVAEGSARAETRVFRLREVLAEAELLNRDSIDRLAISALYYAYVVLADNAQQELFEQRFHDFVDVLYVWTNYAQETTEQTALQQIHDSAVDRMEQSTGAANAAIRESGQYFALLQRDNVIGTLAELIGMAVRFLVHASLEDILSIVVRCSTYCLSANLERMGAPIPEMKVIEDRADLRSTLVDLTNAITLQIKAGTLIVQDGQIRRKDA